MRTFSQTLVGIGDWIPFASRTIALGFISNVTGYFTRGRSSQWCMQKWCEGSTKQFGIKVTLEGQQFLDEVGPCVLVSNHISVADILVIGSFLHRDYRWVAKRSLFKIPFMGWHLRLAGHIPVDREKQGNQARLDADCKRAIDAGASIFVFPEGTRNREGKLQAFRKGAFLIAAANGVPILPIVINGTQGVMEKGDWTVGTNKDRRVSVSFLPPIATIENDRSVDPEVLRERTHAAMANKLRELQGETLGSERSEVPLRVSIPMMESDR